MLCPFCKFPETIVKDSRISEDGAVIRRRRNCTKCDSRFTTHERVQYKEIFVIKKSGEKEFFDNNKLKSSLKMALRKRNIEPEIIERLVAKIYQELSVMNESEISSQKIGEMVMNLLEDLDQVAFVRFASVYKNFNTTDDFKNFISSKMILPG